MKTRVILIASLFLNLGLAAAWFLARPTAVPSAAAPVEPARAAPAPATAARSETERRTQRVATPDATNAFNWTSVEAEDYKQYIANLRAIGCPEETIRDIIIADVNKLYAGRIAALYPTARDFKFWKVEDRANRTEERAREQKRREVEKEKRELIKDLLGIDYETEMARWNGRPDEDDYRLGFLTAEKKQQIEALQNKFREQERALFTEGNDAGRRGGPTPENRAKLAALRAQRESEMAQLLGAQDYQEYQLRNSWTARNMRDSLASFQPSEDEFRKVFEARKTFDDQFGFTRDGGDEAVRDQRRQAQQQLDDSLKGLLGEQRYREYSLAQDERYREIYDFTQRQSLPTETAQAVYDIRQTAEAARDKILKDPAVPPDQRQAALAAIAEETRNTLGRTLPAEALADYTRRDGGWLNRLAGDNSGGGRGGGGGRDGGERRGPPGGREFRR